MTGKKVKDVAKQYKFILQRDYRQVPSIDHCIKMCEQIDEFVRFDRIEKAMRWLGFVQGVLWMNQVYTIEELKNHNKPTD